MRYSIVLLAAICLTACLTQKHLTMEYPVTRKIAHVDDYHGVKVEDPYRWLEDDNAPETKEWVGQQNKVTFGYLEQIPARQKIKERLTELWNYERYGIPFKEAGRYFYTRNNGLQNQNVLYTTTDLNQEASILLDPNTLSPDGTVSLTGYSISEDASYIAYGISGAGSDWQEWRVRNIETGEDSQEVLKWIKFTSASWTKDGKGFFYTRYDEPPPGKAFTAANYYQKIFYHLVGEPQSKDKLVYERPDQKEWRFGSYVTEDNKFLVITVHEGTDPKKRVYYKRLQDDGGVVEMLNDFDAAYDFIGNDGSIFYFETDYKAPRGRVIAINIEKPERFNWKEIVPQQKETLVGVSYVNQQFICSYLQDAKSDVRIYSKEGALARRVTLPGIGTTSGFYGEPKDTETFFVFTSYNTPGTIYHYDLKTGKQTIFRQPKVKFDPATFETKQIFYTSKDGTRVPMFITYKKGLKLDGNNPTLLYGYGGFRISLTPAFSVTALQWMEMGGVYAVPNLRGGGEYGDEWHRAGTKLRKQNVFDDFIAAAEWLIANKYTRPKKLAISGGSNGGLLVAACITQRPDLFGAALPAVGVLDMLRFHKFTVGWGWTPDYGSPENLDEFKALYAYSPYHRLQKGISYPATLITTGDHDDRVVPAHSFKFAARLQEYNAGPEPTLIRIETRAGHGAGKPTTKLIEEAADRTAFLVRELGVKY